jgi:hypothetical protein
LNEGRRERRENGINLERGIKKNECWKEKKINLSTENIRETKGTIRNE